MYVYTLNSAQTLPQDVLDPIAMEVASLACKRRRINGKAPEPPRQKVLVSRHADSDNDESAESDDDVVVCIRTVIRRKSRVRCDAMLLCHDVCIRMKRHTVPFALFNMIWRLARKAQGSSEQNLDHIEWFAGVANIHKAMNKLSFRSVALDITYDSKCHNYIGKELQRRLNRRGGQHLATVCSSWTWAYLQTL